MEEAQEEEDDDGEMQGDYVIRHPVVLDPMHLANLYAPGQTVWIDGPMRVAKEIVMGHFRHFIGDIR